MISKIQTVRLSLLYKLLHCMMVTQILSYGSMHLQYVLTQLKGLLREAGNHTVLHTDSMKTIKRYCTHTKKKILVIIVFDKFMDYSNLLEILCNRKINGKINAMETICIMF